MAPWWWSWCVSALLIQVSLARVLTFSHNDASGLLVYTPSVRFGSSCNITLADAWWEFCSGASAVHAAVTNGPSSFVTFTFQGESIEYWGIKTPTGGRASITLDGGPPAIVDTFASQIDYPLDVLFWSAGNLDLTKPHTLVLRSESPYDAANPRFIYLHRLVVIQPDDLQTIDLSKPQPTTPPPAPTTPPGQSTQQTTVAPTSTTDPKTSTDRVTPSNSLSTNSLVSSSTPSGPQTSMVTVFVQTINGTVTTVPQSSASDATALQAATTQPLSPAVVGGAVAAGFVLLGLLIFGFIIYRRRRESERALEAIDPQQAGPANVTFFPSTEALMPPRREKAGFHTYPPTPPTTSPGLTRNPASGSSSQASPPSSPTDPASTLSPPRIPYGHPSQYSLFSNRAHSIGTNGSWVESNHEAFVDETVRSISPPPYYANDRPPTTVFYQA